MFHTVPTVTASLVALIIAAVIWTVGQQRWPRVVAILVIGGVGGLVGTTVGLYIHRAVNATLNALGGLIGNLFGVGIAAVAIGLAIWLAGVIGFHIHHRKVGDRTLWAAAAFPWTVSFVPGVIGTVLTYAVSLCAALVGGLWTLMSSGLH